MEKKNIVIPKINYWKESIESLYRMGELSIEQYATCLRRIRELEEKKWMDQYKNLK